MSPSERVERVKQRTWLCMLASLAIGMLLFATISIVTPLNATFLHVLLLMLFIFIFVVDKILVFNQGGIYYEH